MKYEVVYSTQQDFADAMNSLRERMKIMIAEGWEPLGGVAVTTLGQVGTPSQLFAVSQAIIKKDC